MLRELNDVEMGLVSGGVIGSMYHKDAHDGPGGLYGPGGQLEQEYQDFSSFTQANFGVDGMDFLAMSATEDGRTQLDRNNSCLVAQNGLADLEMHHLDMILGADEVIGDSPLFGAALVVLGAEQWYGPRIRSAQNDVNNHCS